MTSRPAQPGQRPQPSRSLSGSSMLQRQAQQRSHLNNQLGTPGSSRHNVVDLTSEPSSSTPSRPGPPSRVASALRLETIAEVKDASTTLEAQQQATVPWPATSPTWPRGKPKLMFSYQTPTQSQDDTASPSTSFAGSAASPQKDAIPKPPLRFPPRPIRRRPPVRDRSSELANVIPAQKKDKVPKPYVLDVPPRAPTCSSKFSLDFFPWTGGHPEDKFSTTIITHGYFDKLQIPADKETASLLPVGPVKVQQQQQQNAAQALKQPQSLKLLSHLFTTVLETRRNNSSITAPPTFKPPPRVTLTDTKKETWLKDLANSSIPLRRLSRTIPHGIKNKILLEQCMDKEVPMERAVWLAKCVGANEIRASKRTKGAPGSGGEAKWIRDWTVCVEQFVESTITLCGEAAHKVDGKSKLMYCIRLSSYLYSEQLLDSAHYLDSILASLESSSTAKLPARVFIAGVHSEHLLQYRKTGQRYVAALCARLQTMHESPDRDLLAPVIDRVGSMLKSMIVSHPESLFSSRKWPQYKGTMERCIAYLGLEAEQSLEIIDRRNSRLRRDLHSHHSLRGPRREVITLLDSTLTIPFTHNLGKACWRALKPRDELAQTVLEWATSCYRPGSSKVFVAARLLRIWSRHDLDVNEAALHFLTRVSLSTTISRDSFYHLYSELARSAHFSTSKYIHWLIARGGLRSQNDAAMDGPIATRLLAELPLCDVPESLLKLRKTLLHRASFEVEQEQATIEDVWRTITARLARSEENATVTFNGLSILHRIGSLSRTIKAELGLRLRQLAKASTTGSEEANGNTAHQSLTLDDFLFIRSILEQSSDIAMLADVLKLISISTTTSPHTLAACTDTVNVHRDSLAAIGAFKDLFQTLAGRYRTISMARGSDVANLRTSLCDLSAEVPEARELYIELATEIARSTRKATIEACSPVSDHVVEVLQKNEGTCSEEIEKVLDSGSSMDHTTFVRLFEVLVSQIESLWSKEASGVQRYTALLGRLRTFETKHFCSMLATWLEDVIQRPERPSITQIFGPLINSECVSFGDVLRSCSAFLQDRKAPTVDVLNRIALETLDLALGSVRRVETFQNGDSYKLTIKRKHAQEANHTTILDITRHIIEMGQPLVEGQPDNFTALCGERPFVEFLQRLVIIHFDVITNLLVVPLARSKDIRILTRLCILLRSLLDLATPQSLATDLEPANRITTIIGVASELTLPFCQLALRSVFAGDTPDKIVAGGDVGALPMQAFETAINQALAAGNTTWTSIIPMLDAQVARHLFESAERCLVTSLLATGGEEVARQKLLIIETTAYSMHGHRSPSMSILLMEKLNDLAKHVTSVGHGREQFDTIQHLLPLVMEVISVMTADLDGIKQAGEIRAGILMMLVTIHLHLKSTHLGREDLQQMVFDTILSLADDLDDNARFRCIRQLKGQVPNEQATPSASITTPAVQSGNFASTPGKEKVAMSPAQSSFHIAPAQTPSAASGTMASHPELYYALSFGKDWGMGLMLMQKGKMMPFQVKRWENLSELVEAGENSTSLNMRLFEARKT